jgi:hypothetical protein
VRQQLRLPCLLLAILRTAFRTAVRTCDSDNDYKKFTSYISKTRLPKQGWPQLDCHDCPPEILRASPRYARTLTATFIDFCDNRLGRIHLAWDDAIVTSCSTSRPNVPLFLLPQQHLSPLLVRLGGGGGG